MRFRTRLARWVGSFPLLVVMHTVAWAGGNNIYTFDVTGSGGTVTLDDGMGNVQQVTSINGTPFSFQLLPSGIGQFQFAGDLEFFSGDGVIGTGNAPISIFGLNNISIASGATFDVAATSNGAGPGGGAGASSIANGRAGGTGGTGGALSTPTEPLFSNGGPGGTGGASNPIFAGCNAFGGTNGFWGYNALGGSSGDAAFGGFFGSAGQSGFQSPGGGGTGGFGGPGGSHGSGGAFLSLGNDPGDVGTNHGSGGGTESNGGNGGAGFAGNVGGNGSAPASPGGIGFGGQNLGLGPMLSGGSGGGSGGGGGGGGGAGGGGAGSGGGGGGGGGGGVTFAGCAAGGNGGAGGEGGAGGAGGNGGMGGNGGAGGHGGGAIEVVARGLLALSPSQFSAAGSDGSPGFAGSNGAAGFNGGNGVNGASGAAGGGGSAGSGGRGGRGGNGGRGGIGGTGGTGGMGGGGSGGTVKLSGSVVVSDNVVIDAAGGGNGGVGRFLVGNNATHSFDGSIVGNQQTLAGSVGNNPYIKGGLDTPLLPELQHEPGISGGAETYGVIHDQVVNSMNSVFDDVIQMAPSNASAAVLRLDSSPAMVDLDGDGMRDAVNFDQHDMLLFLSVDGNPLESPQLGIDPAGLDADFLVDLKIQGFELDPLFGGSGPMNISQLDSMEVFATLIPESASFVNASVLGGSLRGSALTAGTWDYVLQAMTLAGDFDGSGAVGAGDLDLVLTLWGQDGSTAPPTWVNDRPTGIVAAEQLDTVLNNWGNMANVAAVPEPTSLVIVLLGIVGLVRRRR